MLTVERRVPVYRSRRGRIVGAAVAIVLVLCGITTDRVFVSPTLAALPQHADAIIKFGGPGDRDGAALTLARTHVAPFLVSSTGGRQIHTNNCLPPVPDVTLICFDPDPATTRGEAEYVGRLAAQNHWTSIILVTSPDQAWRARLRMSRCFGGAVYVSTTPLPAFMWLVQIPYQWAASAKALTLERSC